MGRDLGLTELIDSNAAMRFTKDFSMMEFVQALEKITSSSIHAVDIDLDLLHEMRSTYDNARSPELNRWKEVAHVLAGRLRTTPNDDKAHPRFMAGYEAGLRDGQRMQPLPEGQKFVDLNGHTARVDQPATSTGYVKLSVMTMAEHDDQSGQFITRPQAIELYITRPQAEALAIALKGELE